MNPFLAELIGITILGPIVGGIAGAKTDEPLRVASVHALAAPSP